MIKGGATAQRYAIKSQFDVAQGEANPAARSKSPPQTSMSKRSSVGVIN